MTDGAVPGASAEPSPPEVLARRVSATGAGAPSPDGRSLAFTDWESGDIALRDLVTGSDRRLTGNGRWSDSLGFGEFPVVSRDGNRVAYAWRRDAGNELRVVGTDGAEERTVHRAAPGSWMEPHDWSPGDEWILGVLHAEDGSSTLATVSVADGSVRRLRSFDWRQPLGAAFSPDGRFVAYDVPPDNRIPDRDVVLVSLEGGRDQALAATEADERLVGWAPDGSVYYRTAEGEFATVWRLPMREGRPAGTPAPIRSDLWQMQPLGFSRDALFYTVAVGQPQVFTATLDGSVATTATPLDGPTGERRLAPAWSPEDSRIAYVSGPAGRGPLALVIRAETGESRRIALPLQYLFRMVWAPDGQALFMGARNRGREGIWRVELGSAEPVPITTTGSGSAFQVSPDGGTLYYTDEDDGGRGVVARDLATGSERVVTPLRPARYNLALSPDGRDLAFTIYDRGASAYALWRVPVAEGVPRELRRLPPAEVVGWSGLQWSADGREILFSTGSYDGGWTVFALPAQGGEPRTLLIHEGLVWALRVHPDGRRIAFQSGTDRAETWVMQNLPGLPAPPGGAP